MKVWQFIQQKQSNAVRVILLYVLESTGSSPGRQGFKMAVAADGEFCGTIGGGIMEHKFVELAKSKLHTTTDPAEIIKQVHDKISAQNQSGMICSGKQTIFFYEIQSADNDAVVQLLNSLSKNKNGTLQLNINSISFSEAIPDKDFDLVMNEDEATFLFKEKTGHKNILHIIGGGHCALALSELMRKMDFFVCVYDERDELNTMNANLFAHEKRIVKSYYDLKHLISEGKNVYVVIMTFGYRSDDLALRSLLGKSFKYIGMLGSKNKIEKMFEEYRRENMDTALLEKIKAPIGLFIKSETTDEIAVSIAAEIIAAKNI